MLAYTEPLTVFEGSHGSDVANYNSYGRHHSQTNRQHELDEIETSKSRQYLKKIAEFFFSHVGLVGLVVVYAVAGAFLFQLLEIREEKLNCLDNQGQQLAQITELKQTIVNYIQNNATPSILNANVHKDNSTVAFLKIGAMLIDFRTNVLSISGRYRVFGDNCSIVNKWTYPNSLLFAITVITTIGYGNITPMTWEGQLCCICYATIGIPIFLLCLANISGVLGEMFRFLYSKILCGPCKLIKKRRAQAQHAKLEEETGITPNQARTNGWTLENENKKRLEHRLSKLLPGDDELDEGEHRPNQRVTVPLTVTMIIIAAYIWIGSALFHNFEGWTMIQSGYFCFITLATIGFGDFVPGQNRNDPHAGAKLILGAIYVLFGMAILAMCFDLMQEEIIAKFRWIGTKFGIVEKREESNDSIDKTSITQDKRQSQIHDNYPPLATTRSILNNDNGLDSPTPRNASATRKSSPRNNIARVHPMGMNENNDGTLHQRASIKSY